MPLNFNLTALRLRRSGVFIVNFKHISHLFLQFLLLTLNRFVGIDSIRLKKYGGKFSLYYSSKIVK